MYSLRYLWGAGERFSRTIHLTKVVLIPLNFLTRVRRDFPRAFPFPKRETD